MRKIHAGLKTKINQNRLTCQGLKQNVGRNVHLKILCKDENGSRRISDILTQLHQYLERALKKKENKVSSRHTSITVIIYDVS